MIKQQLESVFQYPLGPLPCVLSESMGELKKINKSSLLGKIEGPNVPAANTEFNSAGIIDDLSLFAKPNFLD